MYHVLGQSFESATDCAAFLRDIGQGVAIELRHNGGSRSCLNKPEVWQWLESRGKRIIAYRAKFYDPRKGKPFLVPAEQRQWLVGDYFEGKAYGPKIDDCASQLPFRYRKAFERDPTIWHERSVDPVDGFHNIKLYGSRGKFLAKIRFQAIREGMTV